MSTIQSPMNFLSLAPVASANPKQTSAQQATESEEVVKAGAAEATIVRANSTSSETSVSSNDAGKQMRFLKLGHHDGDWSEEVIEA